MTFQQTKERLIEISTKINTKDRLKAAMYLGVHPETINRYLRGEAKKPLFALELLSFFVGLVNQRDIFQK